MPSVLSDMGTLALGGIIGILVPSPATQPKGGNADGGALPATTNPQVLLLYRIALYALVICVVAAILGAFLAAYRGITIPSILSNMGTLSLGGIIGILVPSPTANTQ